MNSRLLFLPTSIACAAGCSFAQAAAPADVEAFYVDHCAAMVTVVERQSVDEARRFEVALTKAVDALRAADRLLSYDSALMRLKQGCDAHLEKAAASGLRAAGPDSSAVRK
jgi:thiamine biosynthesis lipoprotein ApbE